MTRCLPIALLAATMLPGVGGAQTLEAHTEVPVTVAAELNGAVAMPGQTFTVVVRRDVTAGDTVVIPAGTRGIGEVTWRDGVRQLAIALRSLDLGGRTVRLSGTYLQSGETASFLPERELTAYTVAPVTAVRPGPIMVATQVALSPNLAALPCPVPAPAPVAQVPVAVAAVPVAPRPEARPMPIVALAAAVPVMPVSAPERDYSLPPAPRAPARIVPALHIAFDDVLAAAQPVRRRAALGWTISD